ncbi:MAG: tRNA-dihydrouridine synthase, partial [Planctomycetota bacterium]
APFFQASLSGYSDLSMRIVARRRGAPFAFAGAALDRLILFGGRWPKRHLGIHPDEHPVGAQIMGGEAAPMEDAAKALLSAGFDAIDLNFACPVPKVLGRKRGGWILSDPALALGIVARVREAVPPGIPFSVKLRRGLDDSAESRERFLEILDGAYARGADAVILHPRTVRQRYAGFSDWGVLAEAKGRHPGRTLVGSGDLFSAEDAVRMLKETGVDGVTIARGAIGNPWIFREARALLEGRLLPEPPTVHEQRDAVAEHASLAAGIHGPNRAARFFRKFGIRYARFHPAHDELRAAFLALNSEKGLKEILDRFYASDAPGVRPKSPVRPATP